jgi:hypothetical protein
MIRRNVFVFILLLGILVLTTDALALPVGQHFGFYDYMLPGTTNPWTHSLDNIVNFIPDLNGTEPNLIIEHALLILSLNFKPQYNPIIGKYVFIASVELDDELLGIIDYRFNNNLARKRLWGKSITDINILDNIADKTAKIEIITSPGWGKLKSVSHSVLLGSGSVVAPEPISMALVGAGLVGLPIAVRFRRLLRK